MAERTINWGKIAIGGLVMAGLIAGIAMYWLQIYAFYDEVNAEGDVVELTSVITGAPEPVAHDNFRGIDADSSPIRYRACFDLVNSQAMLTETYVIYDRPDYQPPEPLVAPGWFDCFDAEAIGDALETGEALAFLGVENVEYGIDRIVAVMPDGRAYAWHQINRCGEVVFDGDPVPDDCPDPPAVTTN